MTNLEKYLYQLRRIEEHRSVVAEKEIRKIYKELVCNSTFEKVLVMLSETEIPFFKYIPFIYTPKGTRWWNQYAYAYSDYYDDFPLDDTDEYGVFVINEDDYMWYNNNEYGLERNFYEKRF